MSDNIHELLTDDELDTIGEVMNISMGSAATALSTMLDKQVYITTPRIQQDAFQEIDSKDLEPAVLVNIEYVRGIEGTNATMLRSQDMQIILDLLMGNEEPTIDENFEFDDMSMSAACEVMNQMMGASATALSEILAMCIDISTPTATLVEHKENIDQEIVNFTKSEKVISISFQLEIREIVETTFACFLSVPLAKKIVSIVNADISEPEVEPAQVAQQPEIPQQPEMAQQPQMDMSQMQQPQMMQPQMDMSQMQQPQMMQPQMMQPQMDMSQMQQPQMMQPQMDMQYNPYMQNPYGMQPQYNPYAQPQMYRPEQASVKTAEFPNYSQGGAVSAPLGTNINLLMGVSLDISVVIGRSRQKIKEIVDFGEGTLIELDKQTGAPAEIVVNGQLLAYGDVIVVGDNFGVRITEIVGTKELLDSLAKSK